VAGQSWMWYVATPIWTPWILHTTAWGHCLHVLCVSASSTTALFWSWTFVGTSCLGIVELPSVRHWRLTRPCRCGSRGHLHTSHVAACACRNVVDELGSVDSCTEVVLATQHCGNVYLAAHERWHTGGFHAVGCRYAHSQGQDWERATYRQFKTSYKLVQRLQSASAF
jgi:hypothetical protein